MKRKKILIVGPIPPPYHGVTTFTFNILNSSLKDNFVLYHLDTSDRRTKENIGRLDMVNVLIAFNSFIRMISRIKKYEPSIVYIPVSQNRWGYLRDSIFILLSKLMGRKIIIHLHGGFFDKFYERTDIFMKCLIRFSLYFVNKGIVLCKAFKRIFEGLIPEERIRIVHNGINDIFRDDYINDRISKLKFTDRSDWNITFMSTVSRDKGIFDFLKAARAILSEDNNFTFHIAGDWRYKSEKARADEYIRETGIGNKVIFTGMVKGEKKRELFEKSDIFVFPSKLEEGQPISIIEAMMAGLPIVGYESGCIKDMVKNDVNGYVVESGDHMGLKEAVFKIIKDKNLLIEMSRNNREKFKEAYTFRKCISKLSKVFRET